MDMRQVEDLRAELAEFVADVFASVPRRDQRAKGDCYLRGLMLDGRRKSIQPMAERLPDGNEQNLQQFVNQSPWDPVPVRRRIAERMVPLIGPDAWAVDDVSFPKDGKMSVAVAHQYCGALGKQANCQVAVSVHAVTDDASVPLQWRLFLPKEWAGDSARRRVTGVPQETGHREKWRLALDTLDELAGWGLTPPVVVADAGRVAGHAALAWTPPLHRMPICGAFPGEGLLFAQAGNFGGQHSHVADVRVVLGRVLVVDRREDPRERRRQPRQACPVLLTEWAFTNDGCIAIDVRVEQHHVLALDVQAAEA